MPDDQTPDLAALALEHRAATLRMRVLIDRARVVDDRAANLAAADAALVAGRPALAVELARRARELAPDDEAVALVCRTAEQERRRAARPRVRAGELFVAELMAQIRTSGAQISDGQVPLTTINAALANLGAGGLRPVGAMVARADQRPNRQEIEAYLARTHQGAPCEVCGTPRWSFVVDPGKGEVCPTCGWPGLAELTDEGQRMLSHRQLHNEVAARDAKLAEAERMLAAAASEIRARDLKIERMARTVTGQRRRPMMLGRQPAAPPDVVKALADLDPEQLLQLARENAALATAATANVEAVAVEARRRRGEGGG